jgi:transposase
MLFLTLKKIIMANKAKSIKKNSKKELMIVNPDAAGIDISSTEYQVCVPEDRSKENNKMFEAFTCDLHAIAEWLKKCNIKTVAMEATGIYWIQIFFVLQDYGFDVLLVNAKHIKNIGEKKTDVVDADWIQLLHSYGLLKASYQSDNLSKQLRNLVRHRASLIQSASKVILHIHKSFDMMNIKIHKVISDITGKTGRLILEDIINGERDAKKLASHRDRRIKATQEEVEKSLVGIWQEELLFILEKSYQTYQHFESQVKEYDRIIEGFILKYKVQNNLDDFKPSKKEKGKKNDLNFDAEKMVYQIHGVNLTKVPGISNLSAVKLLSELGTNFTEKFDHSPYKFSSWANVTPNNKISGGKVLSSKVPRKKNKVGQILRMCASGLANSKDELGNYFRKIKSRGGYKQAVVATAHKLARIIFSMVDKKQEYDPKILQDNRQEYLKNKVKWLKESLILVNKEIYQTIDIQRVTN